MEAKIYMVLEAVVRGLLLLNANGPRMFSGYHTRPRGNVKPSAVKHTPC
jgi:hypothetical protein